MRAALRLSLSVLVATMLLLAVAPATSASPGGPGDLTVALTGTVETTGTGTPAFRARSGPMPLLPLSNSCVAAGGPAVLAPYCGFSQTGELRPSLLGLFDCYNFGGDSIARLDLGVSLGGPRFRYDISGLTWDATVRGAFDRSFVAQGAYVVYDVSGATPVQVGDGTVRLAAYWYGGWNQSGALCSPSDYAGTWAGEMVFTEAV